MATPTKRVFTEAAHTLNTVQAASALSPTYVPQSLNTELQNVGRRIRQNVMEGYKTQRPLSLSTVGAAGDITRDDLHLGSSSTPQIFRTNVETINEAVFSYAHNSSRGLPRFCDAGDAPTWGPVQSVITPTRKRGARGMEDEEGEEAEDQLMDLRDTSQADRPIRGLPATATASGSSLSRKTQSLPAGAFAFGGAAMGTSTPLPAAFGGSLTRQVAAPAKDDVDFGEFFSSEDF